MLTMASFLEANNTAYYKVFKYSPKIVVFDVGMLFNNFTYRFLAYILQIFLKLSEYFVQW